MLKDLLKNPRALLLAILVHVALVLLLVVSLQWVQAPPSLQGSENIVQAVVIDESKTRAAERAQQEVLKRQAEDEAKRKAAADEQRQREAEQRKAEEVKQQERQHEEQLEVERALAEKQRTQEKRLAEQESKRKLEAERQRKADAEAKRKIEEDARRKAETETKRKAESEAKRKAEEEARREQEAKELLRQQLAQEEQARLAGERLKKLDSLRAQYIALITQKVQRNWLRPPSARAGMSCEVFVRLIPGGEVVEARVVKSSGDVMYDRSVETAVFKASPLPMPTDPGLMDQFHELRFVFKPEG